MDCMRIRIHVTVFMAMLMILTQRFSYGYTDPRDVIAINSLYAALENPPIPGWVPNGGDPCMEMWQGVECVNSNITGIILKGANLGGQLSDNLDLFTSMIVLDLSDNHIGGTIPPNLPFTVGNLFLSANQFTGSIPGSLSSLSQLTNMSFSNNHLTGDIPDAFQGFTILLNLDLSVNNMSGLLPSSLGNLLSLTNLYLQDNHLSGSLDVLQDLPLQDLNIENNIFSGPIPEKLLRIPNFKKDGNPFNTSIISLSPPPGPISLPPLSAPTGSGGNHSNESSGPSASKGQSPAEDFWKTKKFMWLGIIVTSVLIVISFFMLRCCKGKKSAAILSEMPKAGVLNSRMEKPEDIESFYQSNQMIEKVSKAEVVRPKDQNIKAVSMSGAVQNQRHQEKANMETRRVLAKQYQENENDMEGTYLTVMPPPYAPPIEKLIISPIVPAVTNTGKSPFNSLNRPASVKSFTIAILQQYTDSFSQDNLIAVGTLGSVYRAELPDGKLLAVKKLDMVASVLQNDEEFLDMVVNISKLQNANLVELEGYCMEHGQRLLISEYCSNGTLHDALHSDGLSKKLSWSERIRIALGAARALEYLHETCHPPIVHQNFRSAKVLLDDKLAVRVSDCGLAPLISAASLSGQLISPHGYGTPEFEMGTHSSPNDVYGFGGVMLELLTGRKSYDSSRRRGEQFLVRWAIPQLHDIDALSRMVDPSLKGAYPVKSLSRFADIISLCVQSEPEFRPPMSEIVQNLLHMIQREHLPTRR